MRGHQHQWKATTLILRWLDREWKKQWMAVAQGKSATTWRTPWTQPVLWLYKGLQKHEATALFLLQTEVIGLNTWLAHIRVLDILLQCACGAQAQTVRHILLHCPDLVNLHTRCQRQLKQKTLRKYSPHRLAHRQQFTCYSIAGFQVSFRQLIRLLRRALP